MKEIIAYCDGSSLGNGSPNSRGGWGYYFPSYDYAGSGGVFGATNNQMELQAAIECVKRFRRHSRNNETLVLHTDSKYVINGCESWRHGWEAKGFRSVKNVELWKELFHLIDYINIRWVWVKGHVGDQWNEHCDILAKIAAEGV